MIIDMCIIHGRSIRGPCLDLEAMQVEKSLRALEKLQFEKGQELFKERKREKDLISEISGGQAQSRNLVNKIQQLDEQVRWRHSCDAQHCPRATTHRWLCACTLVLRL